MDEDIISPKSPLGNDYSEDFARDCLPTVKRCISILRNMINEAHDERPGSYAWDPDRFLYTFAYEAIMDAGIGEVDLRAMSKLFAVLHELTLETAAGITATAAFLPPEAAERYLKAPSMDQLDTLINAYYPAK